MWLVRPRTGVHLRPKPTVPECLNCFSARACGGRVNPAGGTNHGTASSPFGQGPASSAAPLSTSSCSAAALVCVHTVVAHRPGEAYAEPPDEREELEYSRSTLDTLAQRVVSPSVGRVFGPGVGPSGLLDQETHVPAPYGDCDTLYAPVDL